MFLYSIRSIALSPIQYLGVSEPWSKLEFWQVCEIKHTRQGERAGTAATTIGANLG